MSLHLFWPNHFQPRQDLPSSFAYKRNIDTPYSIFVPYLLGKGFKMKWENVNKGKITHRRWQHLKGQSLESKIENQPQQNVSFSLRMVKQQAQNESTRFWNQKTGTHHFPVARGLLNLPSLGEHRLKRIVLLPSLWDSFVVCCSFSGYTRPDQTTSDHIRPDQTGLNWSRPHKTRPAPAVPPQASHQQVAPPVFVSPPDQKRSQSVVWSGLV